MTKVETSPHKDSTTNNTGSNNKVLCLDLSKKLVKLNIVSSFTLNFSDQYWLILKLNHRYNKMTIPHQLDFDHYQKSLQSFEVRLKNKAIGEEYAKMFIDTIDDNYEQIIDFVKNCETAKEREQEQQHQRIKFETTYSGNHLMNFLQKRL